MGSDERQLIVGFVRQALADLGCNREEDDNANDDNNEDDHDEDWLNRTIHWTAATTSSTSSSSTTTTNIDKSGKPWDLEIRTAPAYFHRYSGTQTKQKQKQKQQQKQQKHQSTVRLTVTSPWGVERTFASAEALGEALLIALEDACQQQQQHVVSNHHVVNNYEHNNNNNNDVNHPWNATSDGNDDFDDLYDDDDDDDLYDSPRPRPPPPNYYYYHIRLQRPSGILCVATPHRVQQLLSMSLSSSSLSSSSSSTANNNNNPLLLPCPYCPAWCKGAVGVRWHIQQKHYPQQHHQHQYHGQSYTYEQAARDCNSVFNHYYSERAIVVYNPHPKTTRSKKRTQSTTSALVSKTTSAADYETTGKCSKGLISTTTTTATTTNTCSTTTDDPWELVKCGDLAGLKRVVVTTTTTTTRGQQSSSSLLLFDPRSALDSKGASALLWAAGSGHLHMVQYLIEQVGCNPNGKQQGKQRAFQGRTALHWACRNGHLSVVRYLLLLSSSSSSPSSGQEQQQQHDNDDSKKNDGDHGQSLTPKVDIMAATGDGTIAFHWAAWQNHLTILQTMVDVVMATTTTTTTTTKDKENASCHAAAAVTAMVSHINSYGCNAALWAAQGKGTTETLHWLQQIGCPLHVVNHSGHGILHKAAQRGRMDICEWYIPLILKQIEEQSAAAATVSELFSLIGPDNDGCLPSDLAGMEEHEELAVFLANHEEQVAVCILEYGGNPWLPPSWINRAPVPSNQRIWEAWAGVARIRYACKI